MTSSNAEVLLDQLQRDAFNYFVQEANPANGLIRDCTRPGFPASIAAVGFALAAYPVAVERRMMTRQEAVQRTLTTLRFFSKSSQGPEPNATGYSGFYYHFLDMETGGRVWQCELSTIDTMLLLAGALAAAMYFERAGEVEIRDLAEELYRRVDWNWAQNGETTLTHGWTPERGFLRYRWMGYDEATILYLFGLGTPTHPLPAESYSTYTSSDRWKTIYGREHLYAGPLFIHQYSHIWVDFRKVQDGFMRARGIDYFENSRRATLIQQEYATRDSRRIGCRCACGSKCGCCWGLTASDGPGPATLMIDGVERRFFGYLARGAPYGPDDGTIAPWAAVASLPFAPEIVLPTIEHMIQMGLGRACCPYGLATSFNPMFPSPSGKPGWISPWNYGLNQGPIVLMIENYRSGLLWELMRRCEHLVLGLRRAGFAGGWLDDRSTVDRANVEKP